MVKAIVKMAVIIFIVLIVLFLCPFIAMAADEPDSVSMQDMYGFRNLYETGDVLIIAPYSIPFATTPNETIDEMFIFQMFDTDGATLLGSVTAFPYDENGTGDGMIAFYYSADDALTYEQSYIFRVTQNPAVYDTPTYWEFSMAAYDYETSNSTTTNRAALYGSIVDIATDLTLAWDIDLLDEEGGDSVLSTEGETYFRRAIPNLQAMCPALFSAYQEQVDFSGRSWDTSFAETLADRYAGTWIYDFMTGMSGLVGPDTNTTFNIISILIFVALVCFSIWKCKGTTHSGFMDGQAFLIWACLNSWFSMILLGLIAFLCALVAGIIMLFNRS